MERSVLGALPGRWSLSGRLELRSERSWREVGESRNVVGKKLERSWTEETEWSGVVVEWKWTGGGVASGKDILVVHPSPREGDVREGHLGTGSTEGLQPQKRDWNRRDWNPTRKRVKCTGALHSSFQPNQADSCSVELTEGWCQVAYLERGAALFPRRDPQFTLRGTKVVRC